MSDRLPSYLYERPADAVGFVLVALNSAGAVVSLVSNMPKVKQEDRHNATRDALQAATAKI